MKLSWLAVFKDQENKIGFPKFLWQGFHHFEEAHPKVSRVQTLGGPIT